MSELEFLEVGCRVRGRTLLDSVTLRVGRGEFVALVGANGAGKSTLLRCALGTMKTDRGEIRVNRRSIATFSARERAAALSWLPQHVGVVEGATAQEVVAAARFRFAESFTASLRAASAALEEVKAESLSGLPHPRLSGGERQRVAIASLIAQETQFALLDEPANHLDPRQQIEVYEWISRLRGRGVGVLCVTHDVNLLAAVEGEVRVAGLCAGRVEFESGFKDAALRELLSRAYGTELHEISDGAGSRMFVAARLHRDRGTST